MTEPEEKVIQAARAVAAWNHTHDQESGILGLQDSGLLQALMTAVDGYDAEQTTGDQTTPRVTASAYDDEHYHEVPEFDCTPWFEQAADEDIVALADCGWGGDYPADQVAEYFEYNNHYPEIVALFQYKRSGFECHVNETEAVAWLRVNSSAFGSPEPVVPGRRRIVCALDSRKEGCHVKPEHPSNEEYRRLAEESVSHNGNRRAYAAEMLEDEELDDPLEVNFAANTKVILDDEGKGAFVTCALWVPNPNYFDEEDAADEPESEEDVT